MSPVTRTRTPAPVIALTILFLISTAVPGFDYRPSLLVDALVKDLAPELLSKYQDAFASPPSKLDLTELANMAVAPIPTPEIKKPEIKKPGI